MSLASAVTHVMPHAVAQSFPSETQPWNSKPPELVNPPAKRPPAGKVKTVKDEPPKKSTSVPLKSPEPLKKSEPLKKNEPAKGQLPTKFQDLVTVPVAKKAVPKRPERQTLRAIPPPVPVILPPTPAEQRQQILAPVRSWGFQLRAIKFPEIAASPFDLVVIDHAFAASRRFSHEFSPEQIRQLRTKPDGSRRLVLAYLSIGEAERYRFYWKQEWFESSRKPAWIGEMNTVWDGNYLVRFWEPEWQQLIFGSPEAYLERIKAAGFDGIYIDRADVHAEWVKTYPDAEKAMVTFVTNLAQAARVKDPFFLVVMQNAEELIEHKPLVEAIDAIAKEDLFYGIDHKATENDAAEIDWSLKQLKRAQRAGRKVLVVEYLADGEKAAIARRRAEAEGFVVHFTRRDLGELMVQPPDRRSPPDAGNIPQQQPTHPLAPKF